MTTSPEHELLHSAMKASADELIELHRRIVQIPTVNRGDGSSAREIEFANFATEYLKHDSIVKRTVESAPERANFLSSISGDEPGKTLLLISHSDVVPVGDDSDWRFPPFSAEIANGRIWGRGSNDCKMLVAAELFALSVIARNGLLKKGELRVAVGADEEAGGAMGFGWLAKNEPDFLKADLAINEGGGGCLGQSFSGENLFLIGAGEKGRYEVRFNARGQGTHASVPWGKVNPLVRLSQLMEKISKWEPRTFPASPVFQNLRDWIGWSGQTTIVNVGSSIARAGDKYGAAMRNSLMAQSRMTIVPTIISAGEKSNVVPSRAELRCDARILPGQTRADLEAVIKDLLSGFSDIEVHIDETAAPSVSPFDDNLATLFRNALERTFSAGSRSLCCNVAPTWCTGFTDSRFLREVGTPTYGFQVVEPGANPDKLSIHCIDESIEVGMLLPCALALGHFALDYCNS